MGGLASVASARNLVIWKGESSSAGGGAGGCCSGPTEPHRDEIFTEVFALAQQEFARGGFGKLYAAHIKRFQTAGLSASELLELECNRTYAIKMITASSHELEDTRAKLSREVRLHRRVCYSVCSSLDLVDPDGPDEDITAREEGTKEGPEGDIQKQVSLHDQNATLAVSPRQYRALALLILLARFAEIPSASESEVLALMPRLQTAREAVQLVKAYLREPNALLQHPVFERFSDEVERWRVKPLNRVKLDLWINTTDAKPTAKDSSSSKGRYRLVFAQPSIVWNFPRPGYLPMATTAPELLPPIYTSPTLSLRSLLLMSNSKHMQRSHPLVLELVDTYLIEQSGRSTFGLLMTPGYLDLAQFLANPSRAPVTKASRASSQVLCEGRIAKLFAAMLLSVAQCHLNSVAHRDIKLPNFLFKSSRLSELDLAITDFGFAVDMAPLLSLPSEIRSPPLSEASRARFNLPRQTSSDNPVLISDSSNNYESWFGGDSATLPAAALDALVDYTKDLEEVRRGNPAQLKRIATDIPKVWNVEVDQVYGGEYLRSNNIPYESLEALHGDVEDLSFSYELAACTPYYAAPELLAVGSRFSPAWDVAKREQRVPTGAIIPKRIKNDKLQELKGEHSKRSLFASDAWSLGVCLHLLLYGEMPFDALMLSTLVTQPQFNQDGPSIPSETTSGTSTPNQEDTRRGSTLKFCHVVPSSPPPDFDDQQSIDETDIPRPKGVSTNDTEEKQDVAATSEELLKKLEDWTSDKLPLALTECYDAMRDALSPNVQARLSIFYGVAKGVLTSMARHLTWLSNYCDVSDVAKIDTLRFWPGRWRHAAMPHPKPTQKDLADFVQQAWLETQRGKMKHFRAGSQELTQSSTTSSALPSPIITNDRRLSAVDKNQSKALGLTLNVASTPVLSERQISQPPTPRPETRGSISRSSGAAMPPVPGSPAWSNKLALDGLGLEWVTKPMDWIIKEEYETQLRTHSKNPIVAAAIRAGQKDADWILHPVSPELSDVLRNVARKLVEEELELSANRSIDTPSPTPSSNTSSPVIQEPGTSPVRDVDEARTPSENIGHIRKPSQSLGHGKGTRSLDLSRSQSHSAGLQLLSSPQVVPEDREIELKDSARVPSPISDQHGEVVPVEPTKNPTISQLRCSCSNPKCFTRRWLSKAVSDDTNPSSLPTPNPRDVNIGLPSDQTSNLTRAWWTPVSDSARDLIARLLTWDPADRLTVIAALNHPFVRDEVRQIVRELRRPNT